MPFHLIGFNSIYNLHNMPSVIGTFISAIKIECMAFICINRTVYKWYETQISVGKCANWWCQLYRTKQFTVSQVILFERIKKKTRVFNIYLHWSRTTAVSYGTRSKANFKLLSMKVRKFNVKRISIEIEIIVSLTIN